MAGKFLFAREVRPRGARLAHRDRPIGSLDRDRAGIGDETEADLPPAGELDIDLR